VAPRTGQEIETGPRVFRADIRDRLRKLWGSAASQLGPRALALATYLATADVLPKTVNGVAVEDLSKTVDAIPPVLKITWYVLTGCETLYSGLILQPFYQKLVLMRSDRP